MSDTEQEALPDDVARALYFLANIGVYTPDRTWQQDPRAADAAAVILSLSGATE